MLLDDPKDDQETPPADPPNADPPEDKKEGDPPPADDGDTPPETPPADTPPVDDGVEPEGGAPASETPPADEADDDEDDLIEEDKKKFGRLVDEKLQPIQDNFHTQRVESELKQILADNPEYKPYEAKIRRFVTHKNRAPLIKQGLPVTTVVLEALAPHLQQIGAAKAKAADEKANKTKVEGTSNRPTDASALPDFSKMSNTEIEDVAEKVKRGQFKTT